MEPQSEIDMPVITAKQREALWLVAQGYTSKQIARRLNITPSTVDQRVDAVRQKLGGVTRNEAARIVFGGDPIWEITPYEPIPVTDTQPVAADQMERPDSDGLEFSDALPLRQSAPWDEIGVGLQQGIKPSQLGHRERLVIIAGLAVLLIIAGLLILVVSEKLSAVL